MLVITTGVNEACNIYTPDRQTLICSLFVASIQNKHTALGKECPTTNDLFGEIEIHPDAFDLKRLGFSHKTQHRFSVRTGDAWNLYDEDLKTVIAEIVIHEIRMQTKTTRDTDNLIQGECHSKIKFGFNFDCEKCAFSRK